MFPTFLALVGFFTVPGISEQFATHRTVATAAADSLESVAILPGDFGYVRDQAYDTARFERAISDSGRAADSARGWIPESPARYPCKVGSTWMLCPDRPAAAKPAQPIQLATRAAVAPTSCSSNACRLED